MKRFQHVDALTIDEASSELKKGGTIIAGGTDIVGALKEQILEKYPDKLVNVKTIPDMEGIEEMSDGIRIYANTKLKDIAESEIVKEKYASVADAAKSVATPLIRNLATLGGNLMQDTRCWYYRYPNGIGGTVNCLRKSGEKCYAFTGESRYHSIFGGMRVHQTNCSRECPAHVEVPQYLAKLREGDIDGVAEILLHRNPMPTMTSRVCAHFCQQGCGRNEDHESVNIGDIERYVGTYIMEHKERFMKAPEKETGKKVGIVGAGPAALSAAFYLRKNGVAVTIYDQMEEPGGLLMYAIPEYRLPKNEVRKLIRAYKDMGIEFVPNYKVAEAAELEKLLAQYDAGFIDTGAWKQNIIGIDGEELTVFGLDFLVDVKKWMRDKPGKDVIVVGGGNVAVDVAMTAKRLGAENVTMISLEDAQNLPATKEEMEQALEEGIRHLGGYGPKEILRENDQVRGIRIKKCTRLLDEEGRFNPLYDEESTEEVLGDAVLLAVGQKIDLSYLDDRLKIATDRGRIAVDAMNMTSRPGVFAAGDVTTGPKTVVSAIAGGHDSADAIMKFLEVDPVQECVSREGFVKRGDRASENCPSIKAKMIPLNERCIDKEDRQPLAEKEVVDEANRCYNCSCYAVTPSDLEIALIAMKATVNTNLGSYDAETFFTGYAKTAENLKQGEFIVSVDIKDHGFRNAYDKFRTRDSIDFAIVSLGSAFCLEGNKISEAHLVLGGVAPIPICAKEAEAFLIGKEITEENAKEVAGIALKDAKPLEENAYKVDIAQTLIERAVLSVRD